MSLSTERRSAQNFIAEAQKQLAVAEKVYPCVTVTEPNWTAMISTQKAQIQLLKEIKDTLPTLTTEEELKDYLDEQLEVLTEYADQTRMATEDFQAVMKASAKELNESIKQTMKDTEKQVGRMSESFSRELSSVKETTERHTRRMFLISMIPSAALILLELIRYILSAVSAI